MNSDAPNQTRRYTNFHELENAFDNLPDGKFRATLAAARVKATPARIAILNFLAKEKHPVSVDAIYQSLSQLDRATIYRSLETLVQAGLIVSVRIDHTRAYYETAARKHHHHMVCTSCGEVEDIEGCLLQDTTLGLKKFRLVESHSLEFFGRCVSCAKK